MRGSSIKGELNEGTPMPEAIAALGDDERNQLARRATWKMDIVIMPILVLMYILNYLDRQNIASAKLAGIEEDLSLSPVEYQTSVSILFCSYSKPCPVYSSVLTLWYLLLVNRPVADQIPCSPLPGSIEYDCEPYPVAWSLYLPQYGGLGSYFGSHGGCA